MIAIRICRKCGADFDVEVGSLTAYCESCQEQIAKEDARKIRQVQRQEGMGDASIDILRLEACLDTIKFSDDLMQSQEKTGDRTPPIKPAEKNKKKKEKIPMRLPRSGIILSNEMNKENKS